METFKYTFSKPGACRAAINYYRMLPKSRREALHCSIGKIEKPVLLIWVSVPADIPIFCYQKTATVEVRRILLCKHTICIK